MRIAVVGSGISGLVAAYHLNRDHEVEVYESAAHIGGHTHTVDVEHEGHAYAIDTGFIVFNDWTYPNFIALLDELQVPWQPSEMSFSVRCETTGLEYNGTSINSLFAQRLNFLRPSFLRMVNDILKFNRRAPALLAGESPGISLGDYLYRESYSRAFHRALHHSDGGGDLVGAAPRHAAISGALFRRVLLESWVLERR